MDDVAIWLMFAGIVASMFSFAPTMIVVFRRWFRGHHAVSTRANALSLTALLVFQPLVFWPTAVSWLGIEERPVLTSVLALSLAAIVCVLNLTAFRTWRAFVRAEALAASAGDVE